MNLDFIQEKLLTNEAYLTTDITTINYLLGLSISAYLNPNYTLLVLKETTFIITKEELPLSAPIFVKQYADYSINEQINIEKCITDILKSSISSEVDTIYLNAIKEKIFIYSAVNSKNIQIKNHDEKFAELSLVKTEGDIEEIHKSVSAINSAYNKIAEEIRVGATEIDILNIVEKVFNTEANGYLEFDSDIISGERTIDVSGYATNRATHHGDTLIVDLMPKINLFYADTARTFFFGEPSEKQKEIYNIIKNALLSTAKFIVPGVKGKDIYNFVFGELAKNNMQNFFPHHAGHGFGLKHFESPVFLPFEEGIIKKDMTITIEIGLYIPDEFGIRLEDNFVIRDYGTLKIGNYPLGIENFVLK